MSQPDLRPRWNHMRVWARRHHDGWKLGAAIHFSMTAYEAILWLGPFVCVVGHYASAP